MGFCLERWWWWVCREWPQAEVGDVLAGVAAAASWSWSWSWGAEYGAGGLCCGRWWAGGVDLASSPWGGSAQLQHGHEYGKHPGQPGEGQLLEKHLGLFFVFPLAGLDEGWISSVHGKFISNTWHRICLLPAWARHHTTQCQGTSWQVSFRRDGLHGRASLGASLLMPSRAGLAIQFGTSWSCPTKINIPTSEQTSPCPVDSNELGSLSDTRTAIVMPHGVPFVFRHRHDGPGSWDCETKSNLSACCGETLSRTLMPDQTTTDPRWTSS